MGKFSYNTQVSATFEDRLLAHLQIVIGTKLRRSEPFFFTWKEDVSVGSGRTSLWIHPEASLIFKFSGNRQPQINRAWLEVLTTAANSPSGLYIISEPQPTEKEADRVLYG
ncbi:MULTISPECIES: ATP-dependent DNA ligase [Microbacterium]|uniref:ATP-dependent DNA ligase n=1 Tax=Microbacterium wangchenii TaxID=2541726 RepID=A0ABX5SN04_9MICO|nr:MULTISPECIES: ATP-dependent DNA ligase [Microbacterium]MCK6068223.1 ATP-dependent DNA ligase [Microbacterium sp. EYE_512]QBR87510.1 ATP-dependent DNA ligase [Microbacterium wangchenii]TXK15779.1 ATP-dependent DNA ligase [Microbacterium wangchenii]